DRIVVRAATAGPARTNPLGRPPSLGPRPAGTQRGSSDGDRSKDTRLWTRCSALSPLRAPPGGAARTRSAPRRWPVGRRAVGRRGRRRPAWFGRARTWLTGRRR